jgi:hypothetical protein
MSKQRYLLFAFDDCYPAGGWGDFVRAFTRLEEATATARSLHYDHWDAVDLATLQVAASKEEVEADEAAQGITGAEGRGARQARRPSPWTGRGKAANTLYPRAAIGA